MSEKPERLFVTLDFVRPPSVYRFIEREFVDQFFRTGELRLSSFVNFSKHEDEIRWDDTESKAKHFAFYSYPTYERIDIGMQVGSDVYILCATASLDTQAIWKAKGADAAIAILDTTSFGNCIVHALWARMWVDFHPMAEGYCTYDDGPAYMYWDSLVDGDLNKLNEYQRGQMLLNKARYAPYYRKLSRYREQLEYRWVFAVKEPVNDGLIIHVPEAIRFCMPYYPEQVDG